MFNRYKEALKTSCEGNRKSIQEEFRLLNRLVSDIESNPESANSEAGQALLNVYDIIVRALEKNKCLDESDEIEFLDESQWELSPKELLQLANSMASVRMAYEAAVLWPKSKDSENKTIIERSQIIDGAIKNLAENAKDTYGSTKYRAIGMAMNVLGRALTMAAFVLAGVSALAFTTGLLSLPAVPLAAMAGGILISGLLLENLGASFPKEMHSSLGRSMMKLHDKLDALAPKQPATSLFGLFVQKLNGTITLPSLLKNSLAK